MAWLMCLLLPLVMAPAGKTGSCKASSCNGGNVMLQYLVGTRGNIVLHFWGTILSLKYRRVAVPCRDTLGICCLNLWGGVLYFLRSTLGILGNSS